MFKYNVEIRTNKHHRPDRWLHNNAFNKLDQAKLYAECLKESRKDIIEVRIKES